MLTRLIVRRSLQLSSVFGYLTTDNLQFQVPFFLPFIYLFLFYLFEQLRAPPRIGIQFSKLVAESM